MHQGRRPKALGIGLKADLHEVTVNLSTSPPSVILTGDVKMILVIRIAAQNRPKYDIDRLSEILNLVEKL